jgi:hypothetical protein
MAQRSPPPEAHWRTSSEQVSRFRYTATISSSRTWRAGFSVASVHARPGLAAPFCWGKRRSAACARILLNGLSVGD